MAQGALGVIDGEGEQDVDVEQDAEQDVEASSCLRVGP
jgi:hypothetical protein